ncbi:hypothetical protein EVA_15699 [gut metagenome]|uniref:Uncharacterized protein n=1 Tax=gut metagenome TaxID=749906 RepID=J9C8I7_9ZZZZ
MLHNRAVLSDLLVKKDGKQTNPGDTGRKNMNHLAFSSEREAAHCTFLSPPKGEKTYPRPPACQAFCQESSAYEEAVIRATSSLAFTSSSHTISMAR